ncbi:DUF2147 domain-containing protein [Parasediminibacterium paludis]|uniref:DUF2147 domain-containing protein n=1 Tax=Parasediminibacterium paludis TaxID=908966 RepID=A0ABV8PTR5_9BACT
MKIKFFFLWLLCMPFVTLTQAQINESQILGEWTSPKKDSRVLIYKSNNLYYGKIIWGSGSETKDKKNPNITLRNRDLIGLVILSNFKYDGHGEFMDGSIYDPRVGKTYTCKMTLKSETQLSIRGYIGISLFGRSEVWTKN